MLRTSTKISWFISLLFSIYSPLYAQSVYSTGQVELADGTLKTGDVSYQVGKTGTSLFFRPAASAPAIAYAPKDIRSFQLGSERYISWLPNDDPATQAIFLRSLVAGPVSLYVYERSDGVNVFLLEQAGNFSPINAMRPAVTLATLPACGHLQPTGFESPLSLTSRQLSRYVLAYNRCIKPDVSVQAYGTSARSLKISVGPRIFLPVGYSRLKFNDGAISPYSTVSAKPGIGVSINLTWRGRLGAGLDLAYMSRTGKWNTDTSAKRVWALDELTTHSLYVNPYLRYEFRHHSNQVFTPYLTVGIVFNKLLNGNLTINRNFPTHYDPYHIIAIYEPTKVNINQEAGIDEFGASVGGGALWKLTRHVQLVADLRLIHSAAIISVFEIPSINYSKSQFSPRSYLVNSSFGLNFSL